MAENYGFFNGIKQADETYDRSYDASSFATFFSKFIGNGVYKGSGLNVVPKSGLTVTLKAGSAFINGYWYELTEDMDMTLSANTTSSSIIDLITITLDKANRKIYARKRENVPSGQPERSGSVYDLVVARITVEVGASTITSSRIEDTRTNTELCGFVTGMIDQLDAEGMFNQLKGQFDDWFSDIKNKLTSDVAGSLQKQIDDLKTDVENKTAVVTNTTTESGGLYMAYGFKYPSGFDKTNCYIKSVGVSKISGNGVGRIGTWYCGALKAYDIVVGATLDSEISVRAETDTSSFIGTYKWKVVLEKNK